VGVGIVLAHVVAVLIHGRVRSELFQPHLVVVVQARLVIVDEYRCCDVHGVYQAEPFPDAALSQAFLHLGRDVDERPPRGHLKPQFLAIGFHVALPDFISFDKKQRGKPPRPIGIIDILVVLGLQYLVE